MVMFNQRCFVNTTPHAITIRLLNGDFLTIPPSDIQIRLKSRYKVISKDNGLQIADMKLFDEHKAFKSFKIDLEAKQFILMGWRFESDTILLCSKLVAQYASNIGIPKGIFAVPEGIKASKKGKYCQRIAFI